MRTCAPVCFVCKDSEGDADDNDMARERQDLKKTVAGYTTLLIVGHTQQSLAAEGCSSSAMHNND